MGNNAVVVDIMTIECGDSPGPASCKGMNAFNLAHLKNNSWDIPQGPLRRYTVPVSENSSVTSIDLNYRGMDLYTIHPLLKGKPYQYVWALWNHGEGVWWNSIIKIDQKTNSTLE